MENKPLLIGQLAKRAGVKSDTVRFYERVGLLTPPERAASGYRVYPEAALARLLFIRKAQALGFSLDEIKRILSVRCTGRDTCRHVIAMADATLAETEAKIAGLVAFRDVLAKNVRAWKRFPRRPVTAQFCKLIESGKIGSD